MPPFNRLGGCCMSVRNVITCGWHRRSQNKGDTSFPRCEGFFSRNLFLTPKLQFTGVKRCLPANRYLEPAKQKGEKKKLGTRLLALVPGRQDGQNTEEGNPESAEAITLEREQKEDLSSGVAYQADTSRGGGGGVNGRDGSASGSFASVAASVSR